MHFSFYPCVVCLMVQAASHETLLSLFSLSQIISWITLKVMVLPLCSDICVEWKKSRKCVYSVKSFYFYCLSLFEYSFVYQIIINTVSPMLFSSLCFLVSFLSHEKYVVFLKKNRNMFCNDFICFSLLFFMVFCHQWSKWTWQLWRLLRDLWNSVSCILKNCHMHVMTLPYW
jgi:hypothetical protein